MQWYANVRTCLLDIKTPPQKSFFVILLYSLTYGSSRTLWLVALNLIRRFHGYWCFFTHFEFSFPEECTVVLCTQVILFWQILTFLKYLLWPFLWPLNWALSLKANTYIAQLTTTFVTIPLTQKSCHFVIFKSLENLSYNKFQVICFETIAK